MDKVLTHVIPSLVQDGVFGNVKFISALSDKNSSLAPQFASVVAFINILTKTNNENSEDKNFPVVIKIQFPDPNIRDARNSVQLFINEVIMYKNILSIMDAEDVAPKCYYGYTSEGKDPLKDIVIVDNISYHGYVVSKPKWILDLDHLLLSIKMLAQFHALSYNKKNDQNFLYNAKKLKRICYDDQFSKMAYLTMERGINRVKSQKPEFKDLLDKYLDICKNINECNELICKAEEPFSVVCHGDFVKNNIFYKYDASGRVIDCRVFDFQNSMYAHPAIDLSTFLYMHTTQELRQNHWDELLKCYWTQFEKLIHKKEAHLNFDEFMNGFSKRAVYGYCPSSFFVPMMISDLGPLSMESFMPLPWEEKVKILLECGGEQGTLLISNIILHLLEKKYIQSFIKSLSLS